jgi:hypothetical protein
MRARLAITPCAKRSGAAFGTLQHGRSCRLLHFVRTSLIVARRGGDNRRSKPLRSICGVITRVGAGPRKEYSSAIKKVSIPYGVIIAVTCRKLCGLMTKPRNHVDSLRVPASKSTLRQAFIAA